MGSASQHPETIYAALVYTTSALSCQCQCICSLLKKEDAYRLQQLTTLHISYIAQLIKRYKLTLVNIHCSQCYLELQTDYFRSITSLKALIINIGALKGYNVNFDDILGLANDARLIIKHAWKTSRQKWRELKRWRNCDKDTLQKIADDLQSVSDWACIAKAAIHAAMILKDCSENSALVEVAKVLAMNTIRLMQDIMPEERNSLERNLFSLKEEIKEIEIYSREFSENLSQSRCVNKKEMQTNAVFLEKAAQNLRRSVKELSFDMVNQEVMRNLAEDAERYQYVSEWLSKSLLAQQQCITQKPTGLTSPRGNKKPLLRY